MNVSELKIQTILESVQSCTKYQFCMDEVVLAAIIARRKTDLNQRDEDYLYLLFENELYDLVMRNRINENWRNQP